MTQRDRGDDRDYPDGSVGRYVRERWGEGRTPSAQAARPYVPPVATPALRPAPEAEADAEDVWAYQPDAAQPRRVNPSAGPGPGRPGPSSAHDPFAGVEYGSTTWAAGAGEEAPEDGDAPCPRSSAADVADVTVGRAAGEPAARAGGRGRGDVGESADVAACDGAGDPATPAARGGSGGAGGPAEAAAHGHPGAAGDPSGPAGRGARATGAATRGHLGVAGDPTGSATAGGGDDHAGPVARGRHLGGAGDPTPASRGGHLGLVGDPRPDAPGEGPGARDEPPGPGVRGSTGDPVEPRGTDSTEPRRGRPAEPLAAAPFPRTGYRGEATSGDAVPAERSRGGRYWGEATSGDAVPGGLRPGMADGSVTVRTGHGPPNLAHLPGGSPPGALATPSGPLPAVAPVDGPGGPPPPGARMPGARPSRPAPGDTPRWTDPVAVAAQEAQRARSLERTNISSVRSPERTDLSSARLLRNTKRPPQSGWRRLIYVLSGRMFNPGESPTDIRRRELTARVNQPLLGCYKIAMLSLKGGVGKTTMTATLGATFASLRGDRVVAVDANPDRGTLSQKIPLETSATVRNLLRDAQRVRRYTDVRAYTSQGPSRLEVLASEQDPAVSEAFSEDDYRRTVNLLEHFYNIVLTDCGTGLMHSAMYGVLGVADQLVIVSSGSIDGARSASATMDWLDAHGHGELVSNAVVVINFVRRSRGGVDLDRVSEHFAARCRAVVRIPFDAHLEEGAEIDLDRLEPGTRMALLDLAANVADAFERVHAL